MKTIVASAILAASLWSAVPTSADAATYQAVYQGIVTSGSDVDDLFGFAGADLTDMSISAAFTYLTSGAGTRSTGATYDEVSGGEAFLNSPVLTSAVLNIGSKSFSYTPSYYGDVYTSPSFLDVYAYDNIGSQATISFQPDKSGPTNLERSFTSTGMGSGFYSNTSGADFINFNATSLTISAVPEPATWALMIVGFGIVGGTMRYRTRKARPQLTTA